MHIDVFSDLKATQMNVQYSLIQELILYEIKLDYNGMDNPPKTICWGKDAGAVDHSMVTRWLMKFLLRLKEPWQSGNVR